MKDFEAQFFDELNETLDSLLLSEDPKEAIRDEYPNAIKDYEKDCSYLYANFPHTRAKIGQTYILRTVENPLQRPFFRDAWRAECNLQARLDFIGFATYKSYYVNFKNAINESTTKLDYAKSLSFALVKSLAATAISTVLVPVGFITAYVEYVTDRNKLNDRKKALLAKE